MKPMLFLFSLLILSINSYAQENNKPSHNKHLGSLISSYLEMKDALVEDDFENAKNHLHTFTKEVKTSKEMYDHPEHSAVHETHHSAMVAAVESASGAENIGQLRQSFDDITAGLLKTVKTQEYDETLFVQFCPMAGNGEGSKWLSKDEEIQNPYYGSAMSKCGEVVDEI